MKLQHSLMCVAGLLAFQTFAQDAKPVVIPPPRSIASMPAQAAPSEPATAPDMKKVGYAIGIWQANMLKRNAPDADREEFIKGFNDTLDGKTNVMSQAEMQQVLRNLQTYMQAKMENERKLLVEKNKIEGEAFLAKNAKEDGVKVTASGLQYKVLVEGSGVVPKPTDKVTVNYRGTLIDGTEFDSSYGKQPFTTAVNSGVIPGWQEALQLMKVGSKWKVFVPSDLAYGPRGAGAKIAPNSVLIFEMELLSIVGPDPGAPSARAAQTVSGEIIKVPSAEELKKGAKIEVITNAPEAAKKQ